MTLSKNWQCLTPSLPVAVFFFVTLGLVVFKGILPAGPRPPFPLFETTPFMDAPHYMAQYGEKIIAHNPSLSSVDNASLKHTKAKNVSNQFYPHLNCYTQ